MYILGEIRTIYVTDLVSVQPGPRNFLEALAHGGGLVVRELESNFRQTSLQDLHEAVSIRVIMDCRAVALSPAQYHQVEPAIPLVHKVTGVPGTQYHQVEPAIPLIHKVTGVPGT